MVCEDEIMKNECVASIIHEGKNLIPSRATLRDWHLS